MAFHAAVASIALIFGALALAFVPGAVADPVLRVMVYCDQSDTSWEPLSLEDDTCGVSVKQADRGDCAMVAGLAGPCSYTNTQWWCPAGHCMQMESGGGDGAMVWMPYTICQNEEHCYGASYSFGAGCGRIEMADETADDVNACLPISQLIQT